MADPNGHAPNEPWIFVPLFFYLKYIIMFI
jgi:hypothetical protein